MKTGTVSKEINELSFNLIPLAEQVIFNITGVAPLENWKKEFPPKHDALFKRWYDSFDRNADPRTQSFDYSVYSDSDYVYITRDCYKGWSRATTLNIIKFFDFIKYSPTSFFDVFGGIGLTSILLAKNFPNSEVFYHNSDETQIKICKTICQKLNIENVIVSNDLRPADCVIALEAMEHILSPIEFIHPILSNDKVKYYVDGSSFTIDSIGHFPKYVHDNMVYDNKNFKKKYFNFVKSLGFKQSFDKNHFVHQRFFNGRPNIFVKTGNPPNLIF